MCLQFFPYDLNKPGLIRKGLSMVVPERRVWSGAGGGILRLLLFTQPVSYYVGVEVK